MPASSSDLQTLPAEQLRAEIPALHPVGGKRAPVFLDAPSGTQMPGPVLDAMEAYVIGGMANRGGFFPTGLNTEALLERARGYVRELLGCPGYTVVFGQNMTSLSWALATSMSRDWDPADGRDRIVVCEMDHHANIDPWRETGRDRGMEIAWLPVDPERHALDLEQLEEIVDERCRVISLSLSSNAVGTIADVARIVEVAKAAGAITVVDAVHGLSHMPIDVQEWDADVVLFSAYKIFGPHLGVMAIRSELLDQIRYYKLSPAPDFGDGKAEHGSQNMEAIAGYCASMEFLASLSAPDATLRQRLTASISSLADREDELTRRFLSGIAEIDSIRLARAPADVPTTSTVAFTAGRPPGDIARACAEDGVNLTSGHFYAKTLAERTGVDAGGGWVRVGIPPYLTDEEIDLSVAAIAGAVA